MNPMERMTREITMTRTIMMVRSSGRKERGDSKRILMRGIISVGVVRAICHMLLCIHMPRPSTKVFSQRELPTYKKRVSRALVLTAGKLIAPTAICLKPMSTIKASKSSLIWWSELRAMVGRTHMSVLLTSHMSMSSILMTIRIYWSLWRRSGLTWYKIMVKIFWNKWTSLFSRFPTTSN